MGTEIVSISFSGTDFLALTFFFLPDADLARARNMWVISSGCDLLNDRSREAFNDRSTDLHPYSYALSQTRR